MWTRVDDGWVPAGAEGRDRQTWAALHDLGPVRLLVPDPTADAAELPLSFGESDRDLSVERDEFGVVLKIGVEPGYGRSFRMRRRPDLYRLAVALLRLHKETAADA